VAGKNTYLEGSVKKKDPYLVGKVSGIKRSKDQEYSEVESWVTQDRNRWESRNTRFQRDQNLYMMENPSNSRQWTRNQSDLVILNDARTLIHKVTRILARHPNVIEVPPSDPTLVDSAQKVENWCYAVDQAVAWKWIDGLNNPFKYDQAFYICLRGWLTERTLLNPEGEDDMPNDPGAIFDHQLFDPADIYPFVSGGKITRVCHSYQTKAGEFIGDPLLADVDKATKEYFTGTNENKIVRVNACYYYADSSWYHCVQADSQWIKEPTELGYNPWNITLAQGSSYRTDPFALDNRMDQVGTGILDDTADFQKHLDRAATKLNALLSLEANPPVTFYSQDMKPKSISFEPGARNYAGLKDKVEAHRAGPNQGDFKLIWDILTDRQNRGALPPAFYADYSGESTMAHAVLMAAGRDIMYPFSEALNMSDSRRYKKMLVLYRDFGPSTPLRARMQPNSMGIMALADITAQDIESQGTYVEVTRTDLTPQELIQKINMGMLLADKKVLSLRTFRGRDWLGIKNPSAENIQVLAEQVYLDQSVIKALIPAALSATGQDALRMVYAGIQNGMPMPGSQADQQVGAVPPQGMQPPPGQVPPQGLPPGLPSQVLPPAAQTGNPFTNINQPPGNSVMNQLLALMNGGAQGGAGGGGMPPNPGMLGFRGLPPPGVLFGPR
jgi:hypothetical protein